MNESIIVDEILNCKKTLSVVGDLSPCSYTGVHNGWNAQSQMIEVINTCHPRARLKRSVQMPQFTPQ